MQAINVFVLPTLALLIAIACVIHAWLLFQGPRIKKARLVKPSSTPATPPASPAPARPVLRPRSKTVL